MAYIPPEENIPPFGNNIIGRWFGLYFALARPVMNLAMRFDDRFAGCGYLLMILFVLSALGLTMLFLVAVLMLVAAIEASFIGDLLIIGSAFSAVVVGLGAGASQHLRTPLGVAILLLMGATLGIGAWTVLQVAPADTLGQLQSRSIGELLGVLATSITAILILVTLVINTARDTVETIQTAVSSPWQFLRFAMRLLIWGIFLAMIIGIIILNNSVDQQIEAVQSTSTTAAETSP